MGKQIFNIKGMMRDLDPAKSPNQYAYEIRNLRLTAQEDSTLLALTTEKGNTQYTLTGSSIAGNIVGYCVLNKYITIFTHDTNADYIYRLEEDTTATSPTMTVTSLYSGDLDFDNDTKIEALGVYENENIQKVYWIDGVHQPRFINIKGNPTDWASRPTPFDFLPKMQLNESVSISRIAQLGTFAAGTIQYVLAYYNRHGQQSNAFYTSSLHYISYQNRGASPEDSISCAFKIDISSVDTNFDFVRIYSIHRTSENGTPICKVVGDIPCASSITFIDNGMNGYSVDYSEILYLGGSDIVPYTMEQKNNTLFFGNYTDNSFYINDTDATIIKNDSSIEFYTSTSVSKGTTGNFFMYNNQLVYDAELITTFKGGESYYFGLIAQNDRGQWSNVIPLARATNNTYPADYQTTFSPVKARVMVGQQAINKLSGYKKVKVVILDEPPSILGQGVICPTVYNKSRKESGGVFSQSSWFFRAIGTGSGYSNTANHLTQNRHNCNIRTAYSSYESTSEIYGASNAEVNAYQPNSTSDSLNPLDFFVDWNMLTFHSPDIEFGDIFKDCEKIRIVGYTPITAGITSMYATTSTPTKSGDNGMRYSSIINNHLSTTGYQIDLSTFCFEDNKVAGNTWTTSQKYRYPVLPWHRNASLSAQSSPSSSESWYGLLDSKCMASLRSSNQSVFLSSTDRENMLYDITPCQFYQDDQALLSIPEDLTNLDHPSSRTYAGSVDSILSGVTYATYGKPVGGNIAELGEDNSPIRMKYKSGKHGVFALKYTDNKQTIPPNVPGPLSYTSYPFWSPREIAYPFSQAANYNIKTVIANVDMTADYIESSNSTLSTVYVKKSFANTYGIISLGDAVIFTSTSTTHNLYNTLVENIWYAITPSSSGTHPASEWYAFRRVDEEFITGSSSIHHYNTSDVGTTYTYYFLEETSTRLRLLSISGEIVLVQTGNGDYGQLSLNSHFTVVDTYNKPTLYISRRTLSISSNYRYIYLVDLIGEAHTNPQSFKNTKWKVAGMAREIPASPGGIDARIGDTYYQRYDCLKTYPYSLEDQNQIVEIFSFMCETRVNIDGRYDTRRGQADNTTALSTNFNLLNKAYTQEDNFFSYHYLDPDDYSIDSFSNQIIWTKTKVYGSDVDAWTQIVPTSTLDMDGTLGEIKALKLWNDNLMCFQDRGIAKIMYNERTTISTQQGVPVEIANSGKVDGSQYISNQIGCSNKDSIQVTQDGIYFVDSNTKEIYRWAKGLESLSKSKGFNTYLYNNSNLDTEKTFYDPKLKDVYFEFGSECLVYNEQLAEFTSFLDYDMKFMFPFKDSLVAIKNNTLWEQFAGNYLSFFGSNKGYSVEIISAEKPTEDKIFSTVEFRADVLDNDNHLAARSDAGTGTGQSDFASYNKLPFDSIRAWNEYQDTGHYDNANSVWVDVALQSMIRRGANMSQKFRIWRADIPRVYGKPLERIRNPWARIKLSDVGGNKKTVIHDIGVTYF